MSSLVLLGQFQQLKSLTEGLRYHTEVKSLAFLAQFAPCLCGLTRCFAHHGQVGRRFGASAVLSVGDEAVLGVGKVV